MFLRRKPAVKRKFEHGTFYTEPGDIVPDENTLCRKVLHHHTLAEVTENKTKHSTGSIQAMGTDTQPSRPLDSLPSNSSTSDVLEQYKFLQDNYFASWDAEYETNPLPRRRTSADDPMKEFLDDRDSFLSEFLRCEGRGYNKELCRCKRPLPADHHRCTDCLHCMPSCQTCILSSHHLLPFHRIERWNGSFYEATTLKAVGLRIQLNHPPGEPCLLPQRSAGDDFVIVDVFQVHEVGLDFCGCDKSIPQFVQLLRARLYPMTVTSPCSAVTFQCLKQFHLLSLESKCSAYEYVSSIDRGTCNTGETKARDRYDEFLRVIRQYRNLKMLKRKGRGHDPDGIMKTKRGECAVLCPACPHPGINLPPNWETAPEDKRFLYAQFVGIDANFRLKRKHVSSEERDPSLGGGWAFFVEENEYKQHLSSTRNQAQPKSTCVSHNAVNNPDKKTKGLSTSGVGTVDCARHDFKRPNGVGDLQFGERYANMDYMFFSSLRDTKVQVLVVSYDIVCQWHINLRDRMLSYPHELHLSRSIRYMSFLIPKFHLPAHIESCNLSFSFNLTPGVGRTDGEAPERGWANINPIAQSTKEMGPGARRDTIDDHFNDFNWKKTTQFGDRMLKKIREAAAEFRANSVAFEEFNDSVPEDVRNEWEAQVKGWESDSSLKNPYFNTSEGNAVMMIPATPPRSSLVSVPSERDVRLQLAKEVAAMEGTSGDASPSHVHASVMIGNGLGIEDEQRKLALDVASIGQHPTASQLSSLLERSNYLRRKIASWISVQSLFMAESSKQRFQHAPTTESLDGTPETKAYDIQLWLPSDLATKNIIVSEELRSYEWRLRQGQANDALEEIRRMLRLRSHLYRHKDRFVRGVKANTRSNVLIDNAVASTNRAADRYRIARKAMLVLSNNLETPVTWRSALRELRSEDLRSLSEGLVGDTEGRRHVSWIWLQSTTTAVVDEDPRFNEALRIEWCRSRARLMRWSEEVELLQEEMRRILEFLSWEGDQWLERAKLAWGSDVLEQEGRAAYAQSQAIVRFNLSKRFRMLWKEVPDILEFFGAPTTDKS